MLYTYVQYHDYYTVYQKAVFQSFKGEFLKWGEDVQLLAC